MAAVIVLNKDGSLGLDANHFQVLGQHNELVSFVDAQGDIWVLDLKGATMKRIAIEGEPGAAGTKESLTDA